jgi:uncharacterized protein YaaR (DUF327 family)
MEIRRVSKSHLTNARGNEKIDKDSISFMSVMEQKQDEVQVEKMNKMLQDIDKQGLRLSESQTVENLRQYKKLVKQFLENAVQSGLELSEERGFNSRGSIKIYRLVKEVDKKLIGLTNEVLAKEKDGLRTLSLIGEIKGMLVNIYS